jgi:TRAP-type mannitol/chloroaromatic compound transport system permease small subunit
MFVGMLIIGLILIVVAETADKKVYSYKSEVSSPKLEVLYGIVLLIGVVLALIGALNCSVGNWR